MYEGYEISILPRVHTKEQKEKALSKIENNEHALTRKSTYDQQWKKYIEMAQVEDQKEE
jgi:hypothetical protein